jgi:ABC-2 type transport system permease protein
MTGLLPLLKKELTEQIRTYRLLIVGGVLLFFGLTTPLTLKYLPEIIKLSGDYSMQINIPPPTAAQSLAEYGSSIGQLGVLVMVLIAMGAIANELKHGTALLTLSKPVAPAAFVGAKFIAMSCTLLVSILAASLVCFGYTSWLIGTGDGMAFLGLNLLIFLFLAFCIALTLLFSSLFKSSLAAGGISIAIIIFQGVLTTIPVIGDYLPGTLLGWGTNLLSGIGDSFWWAFGITIVITGLCLYLAQRRLKTSEI